MRKLSLLTSGVILMLSFLMVGCNTMKKLEREAIETAVVGKVSPQQLTAVDGMVNFNYNVAFAPKQFYKKLILKVTPKMQYPGGEEAMQPLYFQGEKVRGTDYPVVEYKGNTMATYNLSFPYRDGMQKGILIADIEAIMGNKSVDFTPAILNTNGVKEWKSYVYSLPSNPNAIPLFTETFVKDVPATGVGVVSGYVLFPLAQSAITDAQKKSTVMSQATKVMKEVLANKDAKITNMIMYVSSSPEGPERLNKNLTTNRFKAAKTFFEKDLGLANTPMAKDAKFIVSNLVNENWDGLYLLLDDSNIKNKATIVKDLKAASNLAKREAVLESYIKTVPELKDVVLPVLRRADFFIFYTVPAVMQVEDQATAYYVPQLQETSVLSAQTDINLLNDLAASAIQNKDYRKAKKLLESAAVIKDQPEVFNNLGIVYQNEGNNAQAQNMYTKASIKKEAKYNLGMLLLQQKEYSKAIPYLKEMPNINLAYAQLMANDNRAALSTLKSLNLTSGYEYYMMAIAAARLKDTQTMAVALQKAIQLDSQLKEKARTDKEFYPYAQETIYLNIVD
ncbi:MULTISPECIES: tetratricopeptide repeat protein [Butyricimonas]|uniref:tetratricopeptide repeat protein n=1 Tax=Butyricimonas TaxID=574697 RepID=UPI0007FB3F72|nr:MULTISPECIES: tetratricopeptide repeat protein [Butyricimonas]